MSDIISQHYPNHPAFYIEFYYSQLLAIFHSQTITQSFGINFIYDRNNQQ